jgi:RNA polymerase sigma factor (sigma-70 family)
MDPEVLGLPAQAMSVPARPVRLHDRMSDTALVHALRAGDEQALAALWGRHAPALRRYAAHILRAQPAIVDDVVQESLLRAHRALLRDDRHIDVRPYLFRIVRNSCLDELARVRTDSVPLHLLHAADEPTGRGGSPEARLEESDRLRATLADLAALPAMQRHALVRRELDGLTHEQVAAELRISTTASRSLVHRARASLNRADVARETRCEDVRYALLRAHDDRRRAPVDALRHVAVCATCRAFRSGLKGGRRALTALVPAPVLGGLLGGTLLATKPLATKAVTVGGAALVAAGGAYELRQHVVREGEPSPIALSGVALPGGRLAQGARVPERTALVTAHARATATSATLSCPAGMRVAGLVPVPGSRTSLGFAPGTVVGASARARVVFAADRAGATVDLAILCRVPDRRGSVRAASANARGGRPVVHLCRRRSALRVRPAGPLSGTTTAGEPLAVVGGRTGWLRVRTDAGRRGWIRTSAAC